MEYLHAVYHNLHGFLWVLSASSLYFNSHSPWLISPSSPIRICRTLCHLYLSRSITSAFPRDELPSWNQPSSRPPQPLHQRLKKKKPLPPHCPSSTVAPAPPPAYPLHSNKSAYPSLAFLHLISKSTPTPPLPPTQPNQKPENAAVHASMYLRFPIPLPRHHRLSSSSPLAPLIFPFLFSFC